MITMYSRNTLDIIETRKKRKGQPQLSKSLEYMGLTFKKSETWHYVLHFMIQIKHDLIVGWGNR